MTSWRRWNICSFKIAAINIHPKFFVKRDRWGSSRAQFSINITTNNEKDLEYYFLVVEFSKNTNFSKCSECIVLKAQMKTMTTKELEEKAWARLKKHNKLVMCGRYCYYAHRIMSERYPKEYLSIIHDKTVKTKTLVPRLRVKSKSVPRTNLGLSLIGMLTHGHSTEGFGHFSLRFAHGITIYH